MKILIVYYSKTGTTKKIAERIATTLNADIESLIDKKKRTGLIGWLKGGSDGMRREPTIIEPVSKNAINYDIVLIGGPLWGFKSIAPAARTYLLQNHEFIKKAGFFMTRGGGTPSNEALNDLKNIYGKPIIGTLDIRQSDIDSTDTEQKVKDFVETIKKQKG